MKRLFTAMFCLIATGSLISSCGSKDTPEPEPEERTDFSNDLVLHYDFVSGVQDLTGNGFDGKLYGTPNQTQSSRGDGSIFFNEVDGDNGCKKPGGDYVTMPTLGDAWANGLSMVFWAKFSEVRYYERLFDIGNGIGETYGDNVILGRLKSTNDLLLESWVSTDSAYNRSKGRLVAENVIRNGELQFFAASISPTGEMKIYVDGVLVASKKDGNKVKPGKRGRNYLAHSSYCYEDWDFKGLMDEFWLYNKVLTDKEVQELYSEN